MGSYSTTRLNTQGDFIFDVGIWSEKPASYHPITNEQIHQFDGYRHGKHVGSIFFYKYRVACRDKESLRHNIVKLTGDFTQRQEYLDNNINLLQDVCEHFPPNTFES